MAKDMTLFGGKNLPSYLDTGAPSEATKALIGSGASTRRISIKGSVFRMMLGSEELAVNEERSLNLIIVAAAPAYARSYYAKAYAEGVNSTPTCWSDDGSKPSPNVTHKENKTCESCPQNIKGSGQDKSKACRYLARVAVMLEGDENYEVYGMSIPATSLFGDVDKTGYDPLQKYAQKLAAHNYDVNKVVTEFRFDTAAAVPKLMFRAVRPVNEDEWEVIQDIQDTEEVTQHIGDRVFSDDSDEEEKDSLFAKEATQKPRVKQKPVVVEDDEDDEEEEVKPTPAKKKPRVKQKPVVVEDDEDDDEDEEPVKVKSKKAEPEVEDDDLLALLDEWADDDDD